jgi:type II secretory pathway pseudopilin PulG
MIAMTIFGMMSIMVMTIYLSTTETARRLDAQRLLAESAREITERLTEDIGQYGFSGSAEVFDTSTTHIPWMKNDYIGSGSEYLNLKTGRYVYGARKLGGIDPCIGDKKIRQDIHC